MHGLPFTPSRDVTRVLEYDGINCLISTHTPLAGRDPVVVPQGKLDLISTHTPLAGRDRVCVGDYELKKISTHTPLAGRDITANQYVKMLINFYSHAPRGT